VAAISGAFRSVAVLEIEPPAANSCKLVDDQLITVMQTIGTFEAKTHLTRLLDRVAAGEQITITRHGTPIARLVPVKPTGSRQIRETIAKLKQFSKSQTLDGFKVKDLIDEGRR